MNKKELTETRRKNLNKLSTSFHPKINAVELNINNTFTHNIGEFYLMTLLRNGVPAKTLPDIVSKYWKEIEEHRVLIMKDKIKEIIKYPYWSIDFKLKEIFGYIDWWNKESQDPTDEIIEKFGEKYDEEWKRPLVVSECRMKDGSRRDLYILDSDETIEIDETSTPKPRKDEKRIVVSFGG